MEKCQDGWFKGSSIQTLRTGVFPGNYVQHVNHNSESHPQSKAKQKPSSEDLIDFSSDISDIFGTTKTIVPPNVTASPATAKEDRHFEEVKRKAEAASVSSPSSTQTLQKYRVTMAYPASGPYELDLKEGDIIFMAKIREDGWCKGTLQRTGYTGLFPLSFVQKL